MPGTACTRRSRSGISYLEVCIAMVILAACIIPAARYLPDLLAQQRALEARYQLSLVAQEKLETAMGSLTASFAESSDSGDLSSIGHADWRWSLDVTIPAAGSGRYAAIRSTAWADDDDDGVCDADEPQVRFDTMQTDPTWSP